MTLLDEPTVGLDGPLADASERGDRRDQEGPAEGRSRRWASPRSAPTAARRSSRSSGSTRGSSSEHFTGTPSRLGGIGLGEIAARGARSPRPRLPRGARPRSCAEHVEQARLAAAHEELLPQGGVYRWRRDGEKHMWDPETIAALQHAARTPEGDEAGYRSYEEFSRLVNEENAHAALLRGLLAAASRPTTRYELHEVEEATEIVKRFSTGAMSLGALSPEAHETLAIAMNRIGGWSNSGEGGEDRRRNTPDPNGDQRRSRIRQVASGRFGVDVEYLSRADQIQIKIAQGAKPGEGGQLPGHKVDDYIGALRYATARHRADLAAAAPRHLLDRGPQAADLRPARRQPRRDASRSSSPPRPASARSPSAASRPAPTTSSSPATTAAPAPPRSPRSRAPGSPGRSASPRPSRRCSRATCGPGSSSRPTARCAPAATSSSRRCSAPTRSGSRRPR